jgi:DNA-binding Lrp family transcriptional regulator
MDKKEQLIKELTINARQSDRELARQLKTTQPTISKLRKKLEKERIIEQYTIIPNLSKMDIELVAFITIKWHDYNEKELLEKFRTFLKLDKNVLFSAPGEGFDNKTKIIMTFHKDYKDYELFLRKIRAEYKDMLENMDSFLISTDHIITNFDFNIISRL